MSKRMATYSVDDADKIASVDGHAVGERSAVGDKSISRRMITYKVDDTGKITSIDGHELNGGGGSTIKTTYTLENFTWDKNTSEKTYNVGNILRTYVKKMDENELPMLLSTSAIINIGTAKFIANPIQWPLGNIERAQAIELVCIVAGTIPPDYFPNYVSAYRVRVVSE